jgi:hypothetical protein
MHVQFAFSAGSSRRASPRGSEAMGTVLLMWGALSLGATGDPGLAPWGARGHLGDVVKRHVQEVSEGRAAYEIVQGGTMDGRNCRSPQGVWQPFEQTWESNRSVRIENVGATDVINPWLSNGQNDFRTLDRIVARAIDRTMTDSEKAKALWWQEIQQRFHHEGDNGELLDPVKVFNLYGYNTCGNDSICLAGLWRKAGLRVAPARLVGHCVTQVFCDGAWQLFDGDMHSIYLLRDNQTVAGEQDLVRDHDLIRRTHTQGILELDRRAGDEWESSIYVFEGPVNGERNSAGGALDLVLRPGEALVWRWGHLQPVKYHGPRPSRFPDRVCNGLWEYRPDFTRASWRAGALNVDAIRESDDGLVAETGKTGRAIWTMSSPYVFVGGRLEADGSGARFALSWDGETWHEIDGSLDRLFPPEGPARYRYLLKCELPRGARLRHLRVKNDLQMAPLALPGMGIGTNTFVYTDESRGGRRVRITHEWVERSASRPPDAPAEPVFPAAGGVTEGTAITFRWPPAVDPDGDAIADYHFELAARADMKWPLSMSFAKLISRTADAGRAQYALPGPGLLNPDTTYYWHVRARDDKGVWGAWSPTWSFTPRGPAPPREVRVAVDSGGNRGVLQWAPSPLGRRPAAYRVYASDEKGFSVAEGPFAATVGISRQVPAEFPANFVVEVSATEQEVVGPEVKLPGANKAFYRVVAVDAIGNRSGPSDYAASPRPLIVSAPVRRAKTGVAYHYPLAAIRSLGDLRTRVIQGKETMNFWDVERLRFRITQGPRWLAMDPTTGLLSGIPDRSGTTEVAISATLERDDRRLDEAALKWGIEKVISSGTAVVGSATQRFTIEVSP